MKNLKAKTLVSLLSLVTIGSLTGCAATREANQSFKEDSNTTRDAIVGAQAVSAVSIADPTQDKLANFGRVQKNWVNPNPLPKNVGDVERTRLPAFFQKNVSLTMPGKVSLVEVLSELQRSNNIRISLNQDIYDIAGGEGSVIGGGSKTKAAAATPASVNDFVYRGTLENALDLLSSKANVSWRWTGSQIELFRFESKTYNITLLAGKTTANSEVSLQSDTSTDSGSSDSGAAKEGQAGIKNNSGSGGAGTAGTSSKQGVSRTATLDSWGDVKNYLLSLMSSQGSIAVMETTGLVTVKDTPDAQKRISEAVKSLNGLIGKQIYINVDVYAVTKDASDDYGLDWNIAWKSLDKSVGYSTAAGSAATNKINIGVLTGPFAGSGVVMQALSKLGKTSVVNQFKVATLNGQPTPLGNNTKIPYISGIQVQSDSNGNPIQSVTTGAIFQGISMNVTPKVQPNGKILLEYAMNLSDFQGFTKFDTGTGVNSQSLSLPTTTLKNILQRASLRSGQALVLSGFKQSLASTNDNGVGSPNNFLLGGGTRAQKQETYLVITVTPYIAQDND